MFGYCNLSQRWAVGAGIGISAYKKVLIPLFADVKFNITKPHKFTPYVECGAGYSFAPDKNANGGLYLNPSVGVQWIIKARNAINPNTKEHILYPYFRLKTITENKLF